MTVAEVATKVRNRAVVTAFPYLFRSDVDRPDLVRLGSGYGGWWVPADLLGPDSICYCAGVGTDITFDEALIERFGCRVWGIDPTPRAIEHVRSVAPDERFTMVPVGLSDRAGELKFYAPRDHSHVSHSVKNIQRTEDYFTAEVLSVRDLMDRLGHDHVDLVKLDIEGAEHDTIRQLLADGIRPSVLCVEYDQPEPLAWSRETTRRLRAAGYALAKVEGLNLTFVRR